MKSRLRLNWGGHKWLANFNTQIEQNLDAAAISVQTRTRGLVSVSGGAPGQRSGASTAERRRNPSLPWTPPHRVTGHLWNNIGWQRDGRTRRLIGTGIGNKQSVGYALWLEYGTRRGLKPRPYMRRGLWESRGEINRLMKRHTPYNAVPWRGGVVGR